MRQCPARSYCTSQAVYVTANMCKKVGTVKTHLNRKGVQDISHTPDEVADPLSGGSTDGKDVFRGDPLTQKELAHLVYVVARVRHIYLVVCHHLHAGNVYMLSGAVEMVQSLTSPLVVYSSKHCPS